MSNYLKHQKRVKQILSILGLFVLLPLIIWGITNLNFNYKEGAQEVERVSIPIGSSPSLGPVDAPITIIEYSDFECPFCKIFHSQTFETLLQTYPNKIKFVYKQFPIVSLHPNAQIAAEASLCAQDQDKFWQMHGLLFENQNNLDAENIKSLALTLELDHQAFNSCLDTGEKSQAVQDDIEEGTFYGVQGTPTFFINGIKLEGALPIEAFTQVIDSELALITPESPTPTAEATQNPEPTETPIEDVIEDDVFFIKDSATIQFTTVGQSPNVSISPNDVNVGTTYIAQININLQNTYKTSEMDEITVPIQLVVNNIAIGENTAYIPLISSHTDGAPYTITGVFTATSQKTKIQLSFDPENIYQETNENNNTIAFEYAGPGEPNSCGGTCGSNYNCKESFFCYRGFCRNPNCPSDNTCGCSATATPRPASVRTATPRPVFEVYDDEAYNTATSTPKPLPTLKPSQGSLITYIPTTKPDSQIERAEGEPTDYDNSSDLLPILVLFGSTIVAIYIIIVLIKSLKK